MIPSSDVDIVIVENVNILDKVAALLSDVPWIQEVKVLIRNGVNYSISVVLYKLSKLLLIKQ